MAKIEIECQIEFYHMMYILSLTTTVMQNYKQKLSYCMFKEVRLAIDQIW